MPLTSDGVDRKLGGMCNPSGGVDMFAWRAQIWADWDAVIKADNDLIRDGRQAQAGQAE